MTSVAHPVRLARITALVVAVAAAAAATVAARIRALPVSAMTEPAVEAGQDSPVLRLSLGDSVADVTRFSTIVLPPGGDPERDPPFIVGTPLTVEYTRPGTAVRFPTGKFTSVAVEYGHAVQLRLSPHLRALTLAEALERARDLGVLVERAGWRRTATDLPLERVPADVEAYQHTAVGRTIGYQAPLARWAGAAGDTLILSIRRQSSATEIAAENRMLGKTRPEVDHFLLSVDIQNAAVTQHYYQRTVASRERATLP